MVYLFVIFPKSVDQISTNEQTITRIVKEVKGLNPTFDAADIRG